jgi:hypothetical protein
MILNILDSVPDLRRMIASMHIPCKFPPNNRIDRTPRAFCGGQCPRALF